MITFVYDHMERFGVAPNCRVLSQYDVPIASNSYNAHKHRPASARSVRDAVITVAVERVLSWNTQKQPLPGELASR